MSLHTPLPAKNSIHRLSVEDYASDGSGIARLSGLVVFIKHAVSGEVCDVKLIKLTNSAAYGKIESIISPSPHRITPACPYFGLCGGCDFWHLDYTEELRLKKSRVLDALRRIGGQDDIQIDIIGADYTESYRNKAQYPVSRDKDGQIITGFYRARSHQVIPVTRCLIQDERADILTNALRVWMEENNIEPYDSGRGIVRHIYIRTSRTTNQTLLCIVANARRLPCTDKLIAAAREACPELCGIVLSVNTKPGNTILGDKYVTLWGNPYLEDELTGLKFRLSPRSFYQVNSYQTQKLYAKVIEFAEFSGNETVLDLYCGIGTITLCMAKHAGHVIGAEIIPEAVNDAKQNAEANGIQNAEFICGDAGDIALMLCSRGESADIIVVDPPRKGLSEHVIEHISELSPKRIIYVSCDPATLARDLKILNSKGFELVRIAAVDMFCKTANIETVCLLIRKSPMAL